jgi:phosphatidylserine decarboxylase
LRIPIHREGWVFIALFAVVTVGLFQLHDIAGWAGVVLTLWCIWFFRDPERETPTDAGLVISPADGRVLAHVSAPPPPELGMGDGPRTRVSIFMNVFNVHVNRIPVSGKVMALAYTKGKFINASFDKASEHNERMAAWIRTAGPDERDLAVVQIAGLVARRIKCGLTDGENVKTGERYGIIRFGSRLDVYLPDGVEPLVTEGQITKAGETILARLGN